MATEIIATANGHLKPVLSSFIPSIVYIFHGYNLVPCFIFGEILSKGSIYDHSGTSRNQQHQTNKKNTDLFQVPKINHIFFTLASMCFSNRIEFFTRKSPRLDTESKKPKSDNHKNAHLMAR